MRRGSSILLIATLIFVTAICSGCGYNRLQSLDEEVTANWSEVLNQYQRRADLIPNLVKTVKGYATHEEKVLTEVTNARAKVGSIQADTGIINDPEKFKKFQQAQDQMSGALSRLLVVSENYPQLKADASFQALQAQLEGTENRIAVARNRYIQAVKQYNIVVRSFPSSVTAKMFGMKTKPNFTIEGGRDLSQPPSVDF